MKIALGISSFILLICCVLLFGACSITLYFTLYDSTPWEAKLFQLPFLLGFIVMMLGLTRIQLKRVIRLIHDYRDLQGK